MEKRTGSIFKGYKDLEVWQKAMVLTKAVYQATTNFPSEERFGLVNQMRRAAVSIPSNLAEGHARAGVGEFRHFVSIAMGSTAELETQVLLSRPERGVLSVEGETGWPPCAPGNEFPGYPQQPLWGCSTGPLLRVDAPSGAFEGSRGFEPPAEEARLSQHSSKRHPPFSARHCRQDAAGAV